MKKIISLAFAAAMGVMAASAQYFCTEPGMVFLYKVAVNKDKNPTESVLRATVQTVDKDADGNITARVEEVMALPDSPLAEIKTNMNYAYDAATDVTTVVEMTAEDFKNMIINTIKESALASGQHISDMELADLEKAMSAKGQLELIIDPKAEVGSKIPNSTLRLNAGQMAMTMNIWEAKFLGTETVTTEAGTYECVKISYTKRTSSPGGNEKANCTDWYAKGIGLVRGIETDKKGNITSENTLFVVKSPKAE